MPRPVLSQRSPRTVTTPTQPLLYPVVMLFLWAFPPLSRVFVQINSFPGNWRASRIDPQASAQSDPMCSCCSVSAGCPRGTFGPSCESSCQCQNGAACDPVSGACDCAAGWTGIFCEKGIGSLSPPLPFLGFFKNENQCLSQQMFSAGLKLVIVIILISLGKATSSVIKLDHCEQNGSNLLILKWVL